MINNEQTQETIFSSKLSIIVHYQFKIVILVMFNKNYLTQHPQLYKKGNVMTIATKQTHKNQKSVEQLSKQLIEQEKARIKEITMKIRAYEVKIEEQLNSNLDYQPKIRSFEQEITQIKEEDAQINRQIRNCQLVQNQVTPMEYYLWKKKQRINTYDASIAQLCRDIEKQRQYYERQLEQRRKQSEQLTPEIEELQEKIANFNRMSPRDSSFFAEIQEQDSNAQIAEDLFAKNAFLKQEYNSLHSTNQILQQNREIVGVQVIDNIQSIKSTLRSFYEGQKLKLIRELRQILLQTRSLQISPLNTDEQSYNIEPLINDYAYKMKELYNYTPERIKKIVFSIVQVLPWQNFNWKEYIEVDASVEKIYNQYSLLEKQCVKNEAQISKLQEELVKLNGQSADEQQKLIQISINIAKLKKKLDK